MSTPAQPGAHSVRTFYTLIVTQVVSQIGSRMSALALSIYIFGETGDVTPLALTALFQFLPSVLGASVAGVLADRYDRRKVMMLADAGQALGTLLLLISVATGSFQVWHLYVVGFVQSLFGMFQSPAFTASVTMMIPDGQRERANAMMQLVGPVAGIIAPALTGVLYAAISLVGVIALDLISFLIAVGVLFFVHIPRPTESAEGRAMKGSVLKEALGGLRFLWTMRPLFWMMMQISLVNFLVSGALILDTPYILARTGSEAALGGILAVLNAGAIVGGVSVGVFGRGRNRVQTILLGVAAAGIMLIGFGVSRTPLTMAVSLFLMFVPLPIVNATAMGLMQAKVPPDLQGRVMAVLTQFSTVLIPLAYLLVGPLADTIVEPAVGQPGWEVFAPLVGATPGSGMGLIMVAAGALLVITTLAVYAVPYIRNAERTIPDYVPEGSTHDDPDLPVDVVGAPTPAGQMATL